VRKVGRQVHLKAIIFAALLERNHFRRAIDMALHEVSAHRRAGDKRAFEVDRTIASQLFQVCSIERFLEQIESELVGAVRAQGQAATIHGNAVAGLHGRSEFWRANLQLRAAVRHSDPKHAAHFFDQSCEHGVFLAGNMQDRQLVCAARPAHNYEIVRLLVLNAVICLALIALTLAVFGQTLGHDFVNYDDPVYVSENPRIHARLNAQSIAWAFTHIHSNNWHPLTTMSHMLDWRLFGAKPGAHHLVNVLLHSANAVLLFLLLQQLTASIWRSAFVAAIFAIHPLHVESVAWISERKDVLSGLFFFLTLFAYAAYTRKPSVARYVTMSILFVCGLLSKPMLVTLPFILLLLNWWPRFAGANSTAGLRERENASPARTANRSREAGNASPARTAVGETERTRMTWSNLIAEKIPLFVLSLGSVVATLIAQRGGIVQVGHLPLSWRAANALSVYLIYIWQMIWPTNLATIYPHPGSLPIWKTCIAGGILVLITSGVLVLRKRRPYLITGWFWYLVMLVPVIGLVQVGSQAHADRYTYLPEIGLYVAITWAIVDLARSLQFRREVFALTGSIVIALFAWRAWIQTSYWHDTERLWNHTFAVTGRNDIAHFNFGEFLLKQHRLDEAIAQFKIALASNPTDQDVNFQMGSALMEKGEPDAAAAHFERTLKTQPTNSDAETNLANALLSSGKPNEAVEHYRNVAERNPSSALAHYNLAVGLHRLGQLPEAIAHYKEALRIDPNYPDAKRFLNDALKESGQ
jgi:protein O-mannosyl-transferase